ncbi:hypothetical protein GDO81_004036 [Engystomops pustulosus]|uniref:Nucleoplasmin core domain-containing protein n=1 Tax=Engystomops pustulosus TaxID=76066 RepID=A0AAV6ZYX0_ENGPU|nr:hypothetical protein GDO81_004036 [Engystomops pustulosus]
MVGVAYTRGDVHAATSPSPSASCTGSAGCDPRVYLSQDSRQLHDRYCSSPKTSTNVVGSDKREITTIRTLYRAHRYPLNLSFILMVNLDNFVIQPPVTFRLKSGSGPVQVSGNIIVSLPDSDLEEEEDVDDDDDDDDEEELSPIKPANKKMRN